MAANTNTTNPETVLGWKYSVIGSIVTLTDYTGDKATVVIPTATDFTNAGVSSVTSVNISEALMHTVVKNGAVSISISTTNTNEKVTAIDANWYNAFALDGVQENTTLTTVDLNRLDTRNITNMSFMFGYDVALTTLNISSWNTENVTDMHNMFSRTNSLKNVDLSGWNTGNVTNMSAMFSNASALTSLDLSKWDTGKVTTMDNMFYNASSLTSLSVSNWNTGKVTTMYDMFWGAAALTSLNLSKWDTGSVTDMGSMFSFATSLTSLDVSGWNTANVTSMSQMFYYASSLTTLNTSSWRTSSVTNMSRMFSGTKSLTSLDVSGWNTVNVTNMSEMFSGASALTTLNTSNWNTRNVTNMSGMFQNATSLSDIFVKDWNTFSVTDMSHMFDTARSLTTLDVSNWYTGNVTRMDYMFFGASALTSLNVSNWNTVNVTNMEEMFKGASSLMSLDVSKWLVNNVTDMYYMFGYTKSLKFLDLRSWDNSKATNGQSGFFLDGSGVQTVFANGTQFNPSMLNVTSSPVLVIVDTDTQKSGISGSYSDVSATVNNVKDVSSISTPQLLTTGEYSAQVTSDKKAVDDYLKNNQNGPVYGLIQKYYTKFGLDSVSSTIDFTSNIGPNVQALHVLAELTKLTLSSDGHSLISINPAQDYDTPQQFITGTFEGVPSSIDWTYSVNSNGDVTLNSYIGTSTDVVIPVADDFTNVWTKGVTHSSRVYVSSAVMKQLVKNGATSIVVSDTNDKEFVTASDADWSNAFAGSTTLTKADLNRLDTANVTNMSSMFNGDTALVTANVSNWNTKGVTNMTTMFQGTSALKNLDLSGWDTSSLTDLTAIAMFDGSGITTLNLNGSKVKLPVIAVSNLYLGNRTILVVVADATEKSKFNGFSDLSAYIVGAGTDSVKTPRILTGEEYTNQVKADLATVQSYLSNKTNGGYELFNDYYTKFGLDSTPTVADNSDFGPKAQALHTIAELTKVKGTDGSPISFFEPSADYTAPAQVVTGTYTARATVMDWTYNINDLHQIILKSYIGTNKDVVIPTASDFTSRNIPGALDNAEVQIDAKVMKSVIDNGATSISFSDTASNETVKATGFDWTGAMSDSESLASVDLERLDTSEVVNISNLFKGDVNLKTANVSGWDTHSIFNMSGAFMNTGLTSVDVAKWNTSAVEDMSNMFSGSQISEFNLSSWTTTGVTDMSNMFSDNAAFTSLDLSSWNTQNVTSMAGMFSGDTALKTLNTTGWNTGKVTNMSGMFYQASALTDLDIANWDVSSLTNIEMMFEGASSITSLDLSAWKTDKLTDMMEAFNGMTSLQSLNVSTWNTSNVTGLMGVFDGTKSLKSLDLSNWDTSNVQGTNNMFANSGLETINISGNKFVLPSDITRVSGMFDGTSPVLVVVKDATEKAKISSQLTDLTAKINGIGSVITYKVNTPQLLTADEYQNQVKNDKAKVNAIVANKNHTFYEFANKYYTQLGLDSTADTADSTDFGPKAQALHTLAGLLSNYVWNSADTGNYLKDYTITTDDSTPKAFATGTFRGTIGNIGWTWAKSSDGNVSLANTVGDSANIVIPTISDFVNKGIVYRPGITGGDYLPITKNNSVYINASVMKNLASKATSITISDVDPNEKVIANRWDNWRATFGSDGTEDQAKAFTLPLKVLDLRKLDTSGITDMAQMFRGLTLDSLDLSTWNTDNVTNFNNMFEFSHIKSMNLDGLITKNATKITSMFRNATDLKTLTVKDWDLSGITNLAGLFQGDTAIESLDLSTWNTSNATAMNHMFANDTALTSLNLGGSFDTSKVTNMTAMFQNLTNLKSLDLANFDTNQVTNMTNMFAGSNALNTLNISGDKFVIGNNVTVDKMFAYRKSNNPILIVTKDDTAKNQILSNADNKASLNDLSFTVNGNTQNTAQIMTKADYTKQVTDDLATVNKVASADGDLNYGLIDTYNANQALTGVPADPDTTNFGPNAQALHAVATALKNNPEAGTTISSSPAANPLLMMFVATNATPTQRYTGVIVPDKDYSLSELATGSFTSLISTDQSYKYNDSVATPANDKSIITNLPDAYTVNGWKDGSAPTTDSTTDGSSRTAYLSITTGNKTFYVPVVYTVQSTNEKNSVTTTDNVIYTVGETPKVDDFVKNLNSDAQITTNSFDGMSATTDVTSGSGNIVVTFGDGSTKTYTPKYLVVKANTDVAAETVGTDIDVNKYVSVPAAPVDGTIIKVAWKDGHAPDKTKMSDDPQSAVATVTWLSADGATVLGTKDLDVQVTVQGTMADKYGENITVNSQTYKYKATVSAIQNSDLNASDDAKSAIKSIDWSGAQPDTSVAGGNGTAKVKITFNDDSTVEKDVPYTVGNSTKADVSSYGINASDAVYDLRQQIDLDQEMKDRLSNVPNDATVTWSRTPDTSQVGKFKGGFTIKLGDGSTITRSFSYTVRSTKDSNNVYGKTPVFKVGDELSVDSLFGVNPSDTSVVTSELGDTNTVGEHTAKVTVKFGDDSTKEFTTTYLVTKAKDSVPVARPTDTVDAANYVDLPQLSDGTKVSASWLVAPTMKSSADPQSLKVVVTWNDANGNYLGSATVPVSVYVMDMATQYGPNITANEKTYDYKEANPTVDKSDLNITDAVKEEALKNIASVQWTDDSQKPDTSVPGKKSTTGIKVTFTDGSVLPLTLSYNVGPSKASDIDNYNINVTDATYNQKQSINDDTDAQARVSNLPSDATVAWKNKPSTDTVGTFEGSVTITFGDKNSVEKTFHYTVQSDKGTSDIHTTDARVYVLGDTISQDDFITGIPTDAQVTDDLQDTNSLGERVARVNVTFGNGTKKNYTFKFLVVQPTKDVAPVRPSSEGDIKASDYVEAGAKVDDSQVDYTWEKAPVKSQSSMNPQDASVLVTYKDTDGSTLATKVVPVKVLVVTEADQYGPSISVNKKNYDYKQSDTSIKTTDLTATGDDKDAALAAVDSLSWPAEGTQPNTNQAQSEGSSQVQITFKDGSTTVKNFDYTVGKSTSTKSSDYGVETTPGVYTLNQDLDDTDAAARVSNLPNDASVVWSQKPNTSTTGTRDAQVKITYGDGTSEYKDVKYTVKSSKTANDLTVNDHLIFTQGQATSKDDFFDGASDDITFTNDSVDTQTVGEHTATIHAKFGDDSEADYTVKYLVVKAKENVDPALKGSTIAASDYVDVQTPTDGKVAVTWKTGSEPDSSVSSADPQHVTAVVTWTDDNGTVWSTKEVPVNVVVKSIADLYGDQITVNDKQYAYKEANPGIQSTDLNADQKVKDAFQSFEWVTTPDTSVPGKSDTTQVKITFKDGSSVQKDVKYTVGHSNVTDADSYNISTTKGDYLYKQTLPEDEAKNRLVNLPSDAKAEWKVAPDTTQLGDGTATVKITFADGNSIEKTVEYTVKSTKDNNDVQFTSHQIFTVGEPLTQDKFITNIPSDAKVTSEDLGSTDSIGDRVANITVQFGDGHKKNYQALYMTVKVNDNVSAVRPNTTADPANYVTVQSHGDGSTSTVTWSKEPDLTTSSAEAKDATVHVTWTDASGKQLASRDINVKVSVLSEADQYGDSISVNDKKYDYKATDTDVKKNDLSATGTDENDALSAVKSVDWAEGATKPDTSVANSQGTSKVKITFNDGSSVEKTFNYTVGASTADKSDSYGVSTTAGEYKLNQSLTNQDAKARVTNLPNDATVEWSEQPNTAEVGEGTATVKITYGDGTVQYKNVPYTVKSSNTANNVQTTGNVIYTVGQTGSKDDFLKNIPSDATVSGDTFDTANVGEGNATIRVVFGDKTSTDYPVKFLVVQAKTADAVRPGTDIKASDYVNVPETTDESTLEVTWKTAPNNQVSSTTAQTATALVTWKDKDGKTLATKDVDVQVLVVSEADQYGANVSVNDKTYDYKQTVSNLDKTALTAEDNIKAAVTSIDWVGNKPDTSVPGNTGTAKVKINFNDGSSVEKDVKYTVGQSTASKADTYDISTTKGVYTYGQDLTNEDAKARVENLPSDVKSVEWVTKPNTNQIGDGTTQVKITFGDGTSITKDVDYTVQSTRDHNDVRVASHSIFTVGEELTTDKFISNLPSDAQIVRSSLGDTDSTGDRVANITVKFGDGHNKFYQANYMVVEAKSDAPVVRLNATNVDPADYLNVQGHNSTSGETNTLEWATAPKTDVSSTTPQSAVVRVTWKDANGDTLATRDITVPVTVLSEADEYGASIAVNDKNYDYKATNTDVKTSDLTASGDKAKDALAAVKSVDWAEGAAKPDTSVAKSTGKSSVTITFNDGSTLTKDFNYNVGPSTSDKSSDYGVDVTAGEYKLNQTLDNDDAKARVTNLPNDAQVEWNKQPDTSVVGSGKATVKITYGDGSYNYKDVDYTVKSSKDANNIETTSDVIFTTSDTATKENFLKNIPSDATVTGDDFDTSTVGAKSATIHVVFGDKTEADYSVNYIVVKPNDNVAAARLNTEVNASDYVSVPTTEDGSTVEVSWKQGSEPSMTQSSKTPQKAVAVVTWTKDGKTITKDVPVNVLVVSMADQYGDIIVVNNKNYEYKQTNTAVTKDDINTGEQPARDAISTITWATGAKQPDTTQAKSEGDTKVTITFSDGSSIDRNVHYTVGESSANHADDYNITTSKGTYTYNQEVSAEEAKNRVNNLPSDAQVEWVTKPDTTKIGDGKASVKITFGDGTSITKDVDYTVQSTRDNNSVQVKNNSIFLVGEELKLESFLTGIPSDATVTKQNLGDTSEIGDGIANITVQFGDGHKKSYQIEYMVVDTKKNVPSVRPNTEVKASDYLNVQDHNSSEGQTNTITWATAPDTSVSSTEPQNAVARVTWLDANGKVLATRDVPVKVTVVSDADQYGADITVNDKAYEYKQTDTSVKNADLKSDNTDALAAVKSIDWAKDATKPDTTQAKTSGDTKVTITFADGSSVDKTVHYTVGASQSDKADDYGVTTKDGEYKLNQVLNDDDAKKLVTNLPSDATVVWGTKPDTSKPAVDQPATVQITFGDGKTVTKDVKYTVKSTKDNNNLATVDGVIYKVGDKPVKTDFFTNVPSDATVANYQAFETDAIGEHTATLTVVFGDNSTKDYTVKYVVV
ncbi:MAG: BspA family leucine-rich repeat surface protein, partial [Bifidobacteriaceae bacterium]|nr:BspA family leucine-rich repeat surface protein [Bifidobacteriaceae bacterium]